MLLPDQVGQRPTAKMREKTESVKDIQRQGIPGATKMMYQAAVHDPDRSHRRALYNEQSRGTGTTQNQFSKTSKFP